MFSLQHRKAKTVWENVYIYNFVFMMEVLYWQMYARICQYMPIDMQYVYVFRHSAYVVKADVIAFDYMADVIAIFSYVILLHIGQMLGPYLLLYNTG